VTEPNRLDEIVGGKYRIVRFLASGGMGSVYEAQHTVVRRRFAVKFLHHELALRRELLARFQLEAEAAGALESEHVAAAVDFGIATDGAPYIVLEYLVGESLEHLLEREGRLPPARATHLVQQACRGVQAAHASGIVHRDLKPHNLFVSRREDGTDLVKVLDFGVAKLEFMEKSGAATRTGTVLGTPSYMSPEQARGEKNVDHLSDVYALGAILYELLCGKKPHPGDSHNAILHHIATQPALPLALALPELPEALVAVVEQALAGEPARRPASAEEFATALAPWVRAEVWPAPKLDPSAPRHPEPSTTLPAPLELVAGAPMSGLAAAAPHPAPERASVVSVSGIPESVEGASLDRKSRATARAGRVRLLPVFAGGLALVAAAFVFALSGPKRPSEPERAPPLLAETVREGVPVPSTAEPVGGEDRTKVALAPGTAREHAPMVDAATTAAPRRIALASRVPAHPPASVESSGRPGGRPVPSPEPELPPPTAAVGSATGQRRVLSPVKFDERNPYVQPKP
jgi:serine/threonine-protein kinase